MVLPDFGSLHEPAHASSRFFGHSPCGNANVRILYPGTALSMAIAPRAICSCTKPSGYLLSCACHSVWLHSSKPLSASHFTLVNRQSFFWPCHFGLSPKKLWPADAPESRQNVARGFQSGCFWLNASHI